MQPKKNIVPIKFKDNTTGFDRHTIYAKEILRKETIFPKPLEYEDIDSAFNQFINEMVDMADSDGKKIPTFTLYSNQRFSEYSQTWEHTDEQGNLLMNFKTISRLNNPMGGSNQGTIWNIPGERHYTLLQKTVLDDNGNENVEIYSMKQPYTIDLQYEVSFITNTFTMVNAFNSLINKLFKARQCYIRPNGHYLPMVLEGINDNTSYTIEDRKFFVQTVVIKVLAYIIHPDDFKVSKYSKQPRLYFDKSERFSKKPVVEIEENDDITNKKISLIVSFKPYTNKVEFDIDSDVNFENVIYTNIRNIRFFVNDNLVYINRGTKVRNGDNIKVKIFPTDVSQPSELKLIGFVPDEYVNINEITEDVAHGQQIEETLYIET